jgi:hypothetical protein
LYATRVDCVHTVCRQVMKFYTKVGVHTGSRAQTNFQKFDEVGSYGSLSASKIAQNVKIG